MAFIGEIFVIIICTVCLTPAIKTADRLDQLKKAFESKQTISVSFVYTDTTRVFVFHFKTISILALKIKKYSTLAELSVFNFFTKTFFCAYKNHLYYFLVW